MAHKPLTDSAISKAKAEAAPYKLADAKGLFVQVQATGAKLWRYRYRISGKENVYALGEYFPPAKINEPAEQKRARLESRRFTLEEARQQRQEARAMVKRGIHPKSGRDALKAHRMAEQANTFESVAKEWLADKAAGWTSKTHDQIKRTLELYVFPEIGSQPINRSPKESAQAILAILNRIKKRAPVTAVNIRKWCSAIFCFAVATLRADTDPTSVLREAIKRPATKHKTPLTKEQIPVFLSRVDNSELFPVTRIALKLLLLLFVRPIELRNAEWSEVDLDAAEWRIPAGRMKKRDLHVVPLSSQAVTLLRELERMTGHQRFLFPNHRRPGEAMAETTLIRALATLGYEDQFTPHGFRATASTLLHEMGFPSHLIELSLAHKERDKTKASYNQYAYIAERRKVMQQWADFIDTLGSKKVMPIRHKAA